MTFADDLALAADLVRTAGALALQMRSEGLEGERKTSVSDVVTAADHAAEELVSTRFRAERPDDGMIGEEGTSEGGTTGRTWYIDPVDGTYNFLGGMTHWCSALALVDADGPVLGAVYHPQTDELWLGGREHPTSRNGVPVSPVEDQPLALVSAATYLHPTRFDRPEMIAPWAEATKRCATVRMLGSASVDLSWVAAGRLGVWYQADCHPWDWYPGRALVEAAGGVTELVEVGGHVWHVAGTPTAVGEVAAAMRTCLPADQR
ncbi:inositol monophosphatase family protein [Arsenicicoccus dermatophilus]|uniref:inositol monophosphatase family protein n=1 Tax=Arsenicicoccus dermatophilus TaxID=1076331 RepID=UPI001F4D2407|nr:inositol monophosphatase family protein [Arsenicicoccus dermatophilus]MCH8612391.1 inositol monophosphatase family protein [Arsenicicoccus dermatophilus]